MDRKFFDAIKAGLEQMQEACANKKKMTEAEGTTPSSEKEKKLAALAEPKDKVTHKDVMVGRGVLAKEDVEQIDELSNNTLSSYKDKAEKDVNKHMGDYVRKSVYHGDIKDAAKSLKKATSRTVGIDAAKDRLAKQYPPTYTKEETETNDEGLEEQRFNKGEDVGAPGKNFEKIAKTAAKRYGSIEAGKRVAGAVLKKVMAKEDLDTDVEVSEVIEKMNDFEIDVKESYSFAEYINAAKTMVMEEDVVEIADMAYRAKDTEFVMEAFTRDEIYSRVDAHKKAGNKVSLPSFGTKGGQPYAEYTVTDKQGVARKYIHHGNARKVENLGSGS